MSIRLVIATADLSSLNVSAFCREHGISRDRFYEIRRRFEADGEAGLVPLSRAPKEPANLTPAVVEDAVVKLRKELTDRGLDAGAETIRGLLADQLSDAVVVPSAATIWRILDRRGLLVRNPSKAPRKKWRRFTAERPNELWQMDATDYPLRDGTVVKIISALDDHSRCSCDGFVAERCNTETAWKCLQRAANIYGWPEKLLRDNAQEFKAHAALLETLGIKGIHSQPYHPQTCGKVERYQQTMLKYLDANGPYDTIGHLQTAVDEFRDYYNNHRQHRALNRATPASAWAATTRSGPTKPQTTTPTTKTYTGTVHDGRVEAGNYRIQLGTKHSGQHATILITAQHAHVFINGKLTRHLTINPTTRNQPLHNRPGRPS